MTGKTYCLNDVSKIEVYKPIESKIKFFHEVLSNPNINEENKRKINRILGQKLEGYLNPTVYDIPIKMGLNSLYGKFANKSDEKGNLND